MKKKDKLTTEQRAKNMAAVKGKNTSPELRVRQMLHSIGYRFRLHRKDLSGKPDIVLPKYKTCIFIHGCFWHQHPQCKRATIPENNRSFWLTKFKKNRIRYEVIQNELEESGWKVCIIWECETKSAEKLEAALREFL